MKKFLKTQLKIVKPVMDRSDVDSVRKRMDTLGRFIARSHKKNTVSEDFPIGDFECSMLTPKNKRLEGVILYLHGGGYSTGNLNYSKGFGTVLCSKFGIRVLCVAYRLAPENVFPAAFDDAVTAYEYLIDNCGYEPSEVILCGESAGGGLCFALCQELVRRSRPVPAGIVTVSPWTDMTASGRSYVKNVKRDPSMTIEKLEKFSELYLYGREIHTEEKTIEWESADLERKHDPRVSPLFGRFEGLPPSLIFVGGDEIMLSDSTAIHKKIRAVRGNSELVVASGMWHAYLLYGLKDNRHDIVKLGRFIKYCLNRQKPLRWLMLDNAAKIFPASRRKNWNNVFRISATLTERIDKNVLSSALEATVKRFPSIAVRIQTGVFWYYLEELPSPPAILDEKPYPFAGYSFSSIKKCAFRVLVYDKRIAVEFYHAVTDGNGALVFFKTLLSEYVSRMYGVSVPLTHGILDLRQEPSAEEMEDCFFKNAGPKKASKQDVDAFRVSGSRELDGFKTNTTFIFNSDEIYQRAKKMGVTVTAYIAAILTIATMRVQENTVYDPRKYKPIKIHIPVNLRNLFPSKTLRNFFLYVRSVIDPALGEYTFDEVCTTIYRQMSLEITDKNMAAMIASNVSSEKQMILRITPLFIKNAVMKIIYLSAGEKKSSLSLSNLGVITVPKELERYIDRFDFVLGVQSSAPYNTAAVTYKNKLYLNVIRNIRQPVLEYEIYKVLRELELAHEVESNTRGGKQ